MLFIDEYDVAIQEAYLHGYYDEMIVVIRNLLAAALKDNPYVEKSLITGILYRGNETPTPIVVGVSDSHKRQAFGSLLKESIFSGLIFYKTLIEKWFQDTMTNQKYELMLTMLTTGEIEIFSGIFEQFVINNLSYFDVSGTEPERVYHAFVLGMLISLSEKYEVKSNKESGYGRYDVMLIPKDTSKIGIVMEFKKIDDFLKTTIEEGAVAALKQIEDMKLNKS